MPVGDEEVEETVADFVSGHPGLRKCERAAARGRYPRARSPLYLVIESKVSQYSPVPEGREARRAAIAPWAAYSDILIEFVVACVIGQGIPRR